MRKKKIEPSIVSLHRNIFYHPIFYFFIFLISNLLLSFVPLSFSLKLLIGLFGIGLPIISALWTLIEKRLKEGVRTAESEAFNKPVPPYWWAVLGLLLLTTRFYKLTVLPFWPLSDEGTFSILGLGQSQTWKWNLLWGEARIEPLFIWLLGLYFKVIPPSLFSIRLLPAVISILTVFTVFWASSQFFSKRLSFIISFLFAFSFGEFCLSRTCMPIILMILFQCAAFGALGQFLKSKNPSKEWKSLLGLSALSGLGFYIWAIWAAAWLSISTILLGITILKNGKKSHYFSAFLVLTFLFILPIFLARLSPEGLSHIQEVFSLSILKTSLSYLTALFWDGSNSFPFGSNWGGFLNPILVSLGLIGVFYLIQIASKGFLLGFGASVLFFIFPGILSKGVELHRVLLLFPFLIILAALGAQNLCSFVGKKWSGLLVWAVLLGSAAMDVNNFVVHYCELKNVPSKQQWRNVQYWNAYQILKRQSDTTGPLYVFSEFSPDYDNKTLNIASYPFDALQNPSLLESKPKWAALILNCNYTAHLIKCFPNMKFKVLKTDKRDPGDPPPFGLFLIPVSDISPSRLSALIKADHFYRETNLQFKNKNPNESWALSADILDTMKDQFPEDPLLISIFWEKTGFFKFLGGHFYEASEAFQKAISRGVPAAHLYYNLGVCLKIMGREAEAEKNLKKAEGLSAKIF